MRLHSLGLFFLCRCRIVLLLPGLVIVVFAACGAVLENSEPAEYVNSLGVKMIRVQPGAFLMGSEDATPPQEFVWTAPETSRRLNSPCHLTEGDWDERPIRSVTISQAFYMSETEITAHQYRQFDPTYQGEGDFVSGISWDDAVAFCRWLSEKEGKIYRLPTEGEWEYACRAGTRDWFSSGNTPPEPGTPNPWGLKNMHTGVLEWCHDWHGVYPAEDQTDPVGPASGIARVIRGGGIQQMTYANYNLGLSSYYARSANRGGLPPNYTPREPIGFRVVQAPMPATRPTAAEDSPFVQQCVKLTQAHVLNGPGRDWPYFKKRVILPIPPENVPAEAIQAAGLQPGILWHNHCPGLEVMPNGDVFAIYFTSAGYVDERRDRACASGEATPDIALMATRLRYGSEQWDMPELLIDYPDINDVAALLWNDNGRVRLFWGGYLAGNPFRTAESLDNGATWVNHEFVVPKGKVGDFGAGQPINNAFRGSDGSIYVVCDGAENDSLLWVSRDDGKTWYDTGGRTGGRHSTCQPLSDGSLLCLGGKSTDIDGYMPQSISRDGGKTWEVSRTDFAALGGNQRPTLIRLSSGRLFFASDYQHRRGRKPDTIKERGSFVALSEDEGKTWHLRTIPGALHHEEESPDSPATIGYSVARQAPNGVIHLVTSMNHPSLHFEMNEAWILNEEDAARTADPVDKGAFFEEREEHPDGKLKAAWKGKLNRDGRYLLDGTETWYYADGQKQWEVTYREGIKVGTETYWCSDGQVRWMWEHQKDGKFKWVQWWPNGQKRSESTWRDGRCVGVASVWDRQGKLLIKKDFSE